jgi:hypothetical protein
MEKGLLKVMIKIFKILQKCPKLAGGKHVGGMMLESKR